MQRMFKHAIIFLVVGAVVFSHHSVIGGALIALGLIKLINFQRHPQRAVLLAIRKDAARYHCRVPRHEGIQRGLVKIYTHYQRAIETNPRMFAGLTEVLESLWLTLSSAPDISRWRQAIDRVLADWPEIDGAGASRLEESLRAAKADARHWRQARREAFGEGG